MTNLPSPEFVRAKTWEEMSPVEREFYTLRQRRRDDGLPQCQGMEYDPFAKYDRETYRRDDDD
jgi:hypothetical protein